MTRLERNIQAVVMAGNTPQTTMPFDPTAISINKNVISMLVQEVLAAAEEVEYCDGMATLSTATMEAVERALHNVYPLFRPTYPDSRALPCAHGCQYCVDNNAARND